MKRYPFSYLLAFAVINWLEASMLLATLGLWSPRCLIRFCAWYARRRFENKSAIRT